MPRIDDKLAKALLPPEKGNRITYDDEIRGFGLRITPAGAKAFVLNYMAAGRERRITIGAYPAWSVSAARKRAAELRQSVDRGEDPMAERHAARAAPTMAELAARYLEEHAKIRKRARSVVEDKSILAQIVLKRLGSIKVEAVKRSDIVALHRDVSAKTPVRANRALSLLVKMFNLAVEWEYRSDNPAKGIEKNQEDRRERYLTPAEMLRLTEALASHRDQTSANVIRLLLLTGARRGEVLGARWSQIDFEAGVWTKPAATTKQKKLHRVPLNAPALALLVEIKEKATGEAIFPGRGTNPVQGDLKKSWASICKAAGIEELRVHDLRHSYASMLASAGLSLPVIGALLGHSSPSTTNRYAHLMDDPLRAATERVGALVTAGVWPAAEVVQMRKA